MSPERFSTEEPTQEKIDQAVNNTLDILEEKFLVWGTVLNQLTDYYRNPTAEADNEKAGETVKELQDSLDMAKSDIEDLKKILAAHYKVEDKLLS